MTPTFRKSDRIAKPGIFDDLLKNGTRRQGRHFDLCWRDGERRRLGIAVSRKIRKIARKNRIRRIVREVFRLNRERFPKGDVIVIAKSRTDVLTNKELREALNDVLADC